MTADNMNILITEIGTQDLVVAREIPLAEFYSNLLKQVDSRIQISIAKPYQRELKHEDLSGIVAVVFPGAGAAWSADVPPAATLQRATEKASINRSWPICNLLAECSN